MAKETTAATLRNIADKIESGELRDAGLYVEALIQDITTSTDKSWKFALSGWQVCVLTFRKPDTQMSGEPPAQG
jgi:hypothetical protein